MKLFSSYIKHKRSDNNIPPLKSAGTLHLDSKDKANILNPQFQMAFLTKSETTKEEFKDRCNMAGNFPTIPDIQITENGVAKLPHNLNLHKAAGPDNITPRVLKELLSEVSSILTLIFRKSYDTGDVPNIWKTTFFCPIFKKGKQFDAINYRPVSLTCISYKIMEHIITSSIIDMTHADQHQILNPLQHGFHKGLL